MPTKTRYITFFFLVPIIGCYGDYPLASQCGIFPIWQFTPVDIVILEPSRLPHNPSHKAHNFQLFGIIMIDCIWMARNRLVHCSARMDPPSLKKQILKYHREHVSAWPNLPLLIKKVPANCVIKGEFHRMTFNVAIRPQFAMCAAVLFHPNGDI